MMLESACKTLLMVGALPLFMLLGAPRASAQQDITSIYRSAAFLGRGDTGIATADDQDAIFYNPAGLAQGKGIYKKTVLLSPEVEISKATKDLARRLGSQNSDAVDTVRDNIGKPNHFGLSDFTGIVLRRAALGVVDASHIDLLAHKAPDQGGLEVLDASADQTLGATFSLADGFLDNKLMLGATTKYLYRGRGRVSASIAEADKIQDELKDQSKFLAMGQGIGADLGLMYQGGGAINPSFGLTVNDAGDTHIKPTSATDLDLDVLQTVNVGVSIEPGTGFSKLKLLADIHDVLGRVIKNNRKKLHLGAELSVEDMLGATVGLNEGYPTAGLYFDLYLVRVDLGMYTEEIGDRVGTRPDSRYFMRIETGF